MGIAIHRGEIRFLRHARVLHPVEELFRPGVVQQVLHVSARDGEMHIALHDRDIERHRIQWQTGSDAVCVVDGLVSFIIAPGIKTKQISQIAWGCLLGHYG